jgi:hypothetical protein
MMATRKWLETPMKVMSVAEHLLEFGEDPP